MKKAAAETEKAWKGAGEKPGLEIWRIVKFEVNSVFMALLLVHFLGNCFSLRFSTRNGILLGEHLEIRECF